MPSKLRKAIGAVKDQTSISFAKVIRNNSVNLDVAVLKATTHEEVPVEDRYVNEVVLLTSSDKLYASSCTQIIAKRIGRTRNWIVALKALMLVLRIFQEGDPYFPREILQAMKRGSKILNLSSFRDDSNSSPWDYTAFVRTFALYLDERLDCFLAGKLQRQKDPQQLMRTVRDMKPAVLLDKITYWQRLLDRAIGTRPTGAAKNNRLVQISLYSVVRESFDLYRDISDGLALLLDRFFHLQYQSCASAYQMCIKASKQFEELSGYYTLCKNIGVGRMSEYPSVQKISDELIETLQEFLKDQASFPSRSLPPQLLLIAPPLTAEDTKSSSKQCDISPDRISRGMDSDKGLEAPRTLLEDLISGTTCPPISVDLERHGDHLRQQSTLDELMNSNISFDQNHYLEQLANKYAPIEDLLIMDIGATSPSMTADQRNSSVMDLGILFDQAHQEPQQEQPSVSGYNAAENGRDGWELVLVETASNILESPVQVHDQPEYQHQINYINPFLTGANEISPAYNTTPSTTTPPPTFDAFACFPTFQATPTFCAESSNNNTFGISQVENYPFTSFSPAVERVQTTEDPVNQQQHFLHEQQLWLQHQNKIIAKHVV
ncbi:hypothetical protein GIB67_032755 [Kingdonia uniflora]|uniref:ENTH domain-containing protein n=1 Tax=Kingdonia uniflora TaxID=39325 RepID=A0A7J7MWR6_9MAGN|nr:hypothetical protein GIB67_032755 [Kingdonia uniflora]